MNCQVSCSQIWPFNVVIVSGHGYLFVSATLKSCVLCRNPAMKSVPCVTVNVGLTFLMMNYYKMSVLACDIVCRETARSL